MSNNLTQFWGIAAIMLIIVAVPVSPFLILTGMAWSVVGLWVAILSLIALYRVYDRPIDLLNRNTG